MPIAFLKILGVLKKIPFSVYLIAAIVILIVFNISSCNRLANIKQKTAQNEAAYKGKIERIEKKNGDLTTQVATYQFTEDELKKQLGDATDSTSKLWEAYRAEKVKKEQIKFITVIETRYITPEIEIDNTVADVDSAGNIKLMFSYDSPGRFIEGMTEFRVQPARFAPVYHTLQQGDTYSKLALAHHTSVRELKEMNLDNPEFPNHNLLDETNLPIGQRLIVGHVLQTPDSLIEAMYHEVSPGETLYSISRMYDTSIDKLKSINGLTSNQINEGDFLVIDVFTLDPGNTTILRDEFVVDLVVGVKQEKDSDGNWINKIFVTPKDTSMKIGSVEGAIIDEAQLETMLGGLAGGQDLFGIKGVKPNIIGIGGGFNIGVYKSLSSGKVEIGYGGSLGFYYVRRIFSWGKKK